MIAMPPVKIDGQDFVTVTEAVARMGCTGGWVRMLIRTGRLPATKLHSRLWLVPVEAADAAKTTLTSRSVGKRHLAERPAAARSKRPAAKAARRGRKGR